MIIIYSDKASSRLTYVCQFIFSDVLNLNYELVHEVSKFENSEGIKINYSDKALDGIQIIPAGLLFQNGIQPQEFKTSAWKGFPVIFSNEKPLISFDLFSAIFFLISRYEEYIPHQKDSHGRYLSKNSILSKMETLTLPIVDLWCLAFYEMIFPSESLDRKYRFISTVDIDNAYAYKFKPFFIKAGGTLKSILRADWIDIKRRFKTYFSLSQDPYDTYDFISEIHNENNAESIYFTLLSDRNQWDRNLRYTNFKFRGLISALQRKGGVGIHPGYNSYLNKEITRKEIFRLEDILGEKVEHSRQHFLKFQFPETPRQLVELGIKHDYSLGYSEQIGFRAGTCTPFKFFDLQKDEVTELVLHSSAVMDTALNRYMGLTPESAVRAASEIIKVVKEVKGEFVMIWHNETLSDIREWKGWRPVFKELVSLAKSS